MTMVPKSFSKFDLFRKVPEHLSERSSLGTVFTVLTLVLSVYLITVNFRSYQDTSIHSIVVMDDHQEDQLRINFNISLLAIPCQFASVDVSDYIGMQLINITRHLRHFQLATTAHSPGNVQRVQEIVIHDGDKGLPTWGGVSRTTREGVHYSHQLDTETFDMFMKKYELVLINYYAQWCPFSQQLNPEWEEAAAQLRDHPEYSETVAMATVDCTDQKSAWLCRRAHVRAFPSMLIYIYGNTYTRYIYNGPRDAAHILQFLDLFYRRLEPDMDFAEETFLSEGTGALAHHQGLNQENLQSLNANNPEKNVKLPVGSVEGCEVSGSLNVNRVPSRLVFTARSKDLSFDLRGINVTHVVHHLSFGQVTRKQSTKSTQLSMSFDHFPLDGKTFRTENENITVEHFLSVIGVDHMEAKSKHMGLVERTYQIVARSNQYNATDMLPAALFTFDISPLVIQMSSDSTPFYRFLTSLCAIVGGMVTIIGFVDAGAYHAMNSIKRKRQLGKLN
uniref:Thioredoxinlike protein putative n=1 Tax=Albugo laibachii Nc14 TaxID=890382 RepID=F0WFQ0_9STRA|nr:thioredoxinlike protein putative [Albugo laibachii Nc14]|eukprot:CCA20033.1 thioredoxinlike protein putative [Albugo laibachii Nc14]